MSALLPLAVEPIRLATGADAPPPEGLDTPTLILAAAGIAIALLLLAVPIRFLLPRISFDRDPRERAFRTLARKLRLKRTHRATLRQLAERIETPPIALTICRSAFTRAVSAAAASDPQAQADPQPLLLDLEHKLFG